MKMNSSKSDTHTNLRWGWASFCLLSIFLVYLICLSMTDQRKAQAQTENRVYYFPVIFNEYSSPTWEQIEFGGQQVTDLYLDPLSSNRLFASVYATGLFETVDGGTTWTQQPIFARINDIQPHPNVSSTMYLAAWSTYGVYWTQNTGQSWEPIPGWENLSPTLYSITVSPISPTLMLAGAGSWEGTGGEIFKTVDGGQVWYTVSPTHTNALVYAFDPTSSTTIYAGTLYAGVMKSVDSGDSWVPANDGLPTGISGAHDIQTLAFHPYFPDQLFATTSLGLYLRNAHSGYWQNTWQGDVNAVAFQNDSIIYLGTNSGIFVSYNNGLSWQSIGQCGNGVVINHLAFDPFDSNTLWIATNDGIWQCNF